MADVSVLNGKRVFLVEDEVLVAMLMEDILADQGCVLAASVGRVADALALIHSDPLSIDMAILDVNVAGEPVFEVASALEALNIPFAFATGYGPGGLPPRWQGRPTLQKPFTAADVAAVLRQISR